ncbi:MATE family efflux transporter [Treponema sp.]|uniref:MATE family efflux transporter n=1 Tax=Treponema sp. TaxID=166 RepID=UPI0025810D7D|nr:MATE family efflux transporter [Treponema sp.]MBE6353193.1 MATE family efflux transporter [Treponema sp.]
MKLEKFYSSVFKIALPIILQNMLMTLVNMLDTIMIGRLGKVEIAAVGLGNQIFFLLNMVLFGISSGGSIFIAQYFGKKDFAGIKRTVGIMVTFSFIAALIFSVGAVFFPSALMRFYSKDAAVLALGEEYLRTVGLSYILIALSFPFQFAFRSTNHVILPTVTTAVAFLVNALLNYLLIFGFGSVSPMGVKGAAIATVISRFLEFAILIVYSYRKKFSSCGSFREMFSFDSSALAKFFKIALPVIINESLWGFGVTMQNSIFSHAGTDIIAAFNITGSISQLTWVFFIGVGNAAGIIIGHKIGEGNHDLAKAYAHRFAWFMPLCAVFLGMLLFPLSALLPLLFKVGPEVITQAQRMLYILMCLYPVNAFNMFFIVGLCRSGGDTVYAAVNDIGWMYLISIPLACVVAFVLHAPGHLIYMAICTEQIFKASAGLLRLKSGKWYKVLS